MCRDRLYEDIEIVPALYIFHIAQSNYCLYGVPSRFHLPYAQADDGHKGLDLSCLGGCAFAQSSQYLIRIRLFYGVRQGNPLITPC